MSARVVVKVVPGSSRTCVAGWLGDVLKVRVAAPPERGQANAAVEKLLAEQLDVSRSAVSIVAGAASTKKVVEIAGLSRDEVRRRLDARSV